MEKTLWIQFSYKGKVLCQYDRANEFEGERKATAELLAYKYGIPVNDIIVALVW